jgi:hypothetical protein
LRRDRYNFAELGNAEEEVGHHLPLHLPPPHQVSRRKSNGFIMQESEEAQRKIKKEKIILLLI